MEQDTKFRGLVLDSISHFHAAISLMEGDYRDSYQASIGFLLHLSVELLFKAIIFKQKGCFPAIHDLDRLFGQIKNVGMSENYEALVHKVKRFDLLRYYNTDNLDDISPVDLDDLEFFWKTTIELYPAIKKIVEAIKPSEYYRVTLSPFMKGRTYVLETMVGEDGNVRCEAKVAGFDEPCPFCDDVNCSHLQEN